MGRPGWPELACSTASTDRKRMVLIACSSRLDCVMLGPLLVVSSRTAGPPSRDILPLALLAELPVHDARDQLIPGCHKRLGAVSLEVDRDMPQLPPPRPNGLAQPVGVRYNPLHLMINLEDRRRAGDRRRPGGDRGPGAAVTVDAGPLTNWVGDAGFLERLHVQVRTLAIHGDTTWHQGTVTGKAEGGVDQRRSPGI